MPFLLQINENEFMGKILWREGGGGGGGRGSKQIFAKSEDTAFVTPPISLDSGQISYL